MKYILKPLKKDLEVCVTVINENKEKIESIIGGVFSIDVRTRSIVIETETEFQLNSLSQFLSTVLPKKTKVPYWG